MAEELKPSFLPDSMKIDSSTVAVITGAATGIGAELARTLVRRGAKVVCGDVNEKGIAELQSELGDACATLRADVSDPADIRALIELAKSRFGGFDVFVNNAAAGQVGNFLVGSSQNSLVPSPFGDDVFAVTSRLFNVNCAGVAYGYRLAAEEFMRDRRRGIILTVGSRETVNPQSWILIELIVRRLLWAGFIPRFTNRPTGPPKLPSWPLSAR